MWGRLTLRLNEGLNVTVVSDVCAAVSPYFNMLLAEIQSFKSNLNIWPRWIKHTHASNRRSLVSNYISKHLWASRGSKIMFRLKMCGFSCRQKDGVRSQDVSSNVFQFCPHKHSWTVSWRLIRRWFCMRKCWKSSLEQWSLASQSSRLGTVPPPPKRKANDCAHPIICDNAALMG